MKIMIMWAIVSPEHIASIMCWLTENNQLIDNHLDVCVLHNELSESQNDKQKYTRDTWCSGSVKQMVV